MPSINTLHEEFKAQGLTVLLVDIREDRDTVRRAATARRYAAPIGLDTDGQFADAFRVTGTPTVFLLDRQLDVIGRAIGRRDWESEEGHRLLTAILAPPAAHRP